MVFDPRMLMKPNDDDGTGSGAPVITDPFQAPKMPPVQASVPPAAPPVAVADDDGPSRLLPRITPEDLAAAHERKATLAALGGVGDALANQQSFGNFFLGHMNPHQDVSGGLKPLMDQADQNVKDKQVLLKQATDRPQVELAQRMNDPTSTESKFVAAKANAIVGRLMEDPQVRKNPELSARYQNMSDQLKKGGMSGMAITTLLDNDKALGDLFKADASGEKIAAAMANLQRQQDNFERKFGMAQDTQAVKAGDRITNDGPIKTLTAQMQLTQRGLGILKKERVTNQEFNDVQQELSNAIAGAKGAALGKLERTEYDTYSQKLSEIKQKLTGRPQDAVPPEILARVQGLASDMVNSFAQHRSERAETLRRQYGANPGAQREQDAAIQGYGYQPPAPRGAAPGGDGGVPGMGSAQAAPGSRRKVSSQEVQDYATKHGMNPNAAAMWLRSQGYGTD
jgi:hypothetical protein